MADPHVVRVPLADAPPEVRRYLGRGGRVLSEAERFWRVWLNGPQAEALETFLAERLGEPAGR